MASTIFFKFQSQKALSKILFDGTGITVFDLKREIIRMYNVTANVDVVLRLYNPEKEEYQDDTQVIARSSTVVGRLSPARGAMKANITRYIAGKPRMLKSTGDTGHTNSGFMQQQQAAQQAAMAQQAQAASSGSGSEQDRINAMFSQQDDQWKEAQETLASAQTYHFNRPQQSQSTDDAPPPGYICYRCGAKDHWIKNCPTNNDPNFEGKRIKRTTGIPKTSLKTIQDPSQLTDEERASMNFMVNDAGEYVVAVADKKSWESYQKRTATVKKQYNVKDKTLMDPIRNELMENPVNTPCCGKTYSRLSIEDKLLEKDFVCPNCGKEDVLLDSLMPNEEIDQKIKAFIEAEEAKNPTPGAANSTKRSAGDSDEPDAKRQRVTEPAVGLPSRPGVIMPNAGMPAPLPPNAMPFFPMMFPPNMANANQSRK